MKLQYFLLVQDSIKDGDPSISGPFSGPAQAKEEALQFDLEDGRIFTILAQNSDRLTFTQVAQAISPSSSLSWK